MFKCIGHQTKKGSFTDDRTGEVKPYDNQIFHCISDTDNKVNGMSATQIKVKTEQCAELGITDYASFIGADIMPITGLQNGEIKIIGLMKIPVPVSLDENPVASDDKKVDVKVEVGEPVGTGNNKSGNNNRG